MSLSHIQTKFASVSRGRAQRPEARPKLRADNIQLAYGYPFPGSFPIDQLISSASRALEREGTRALQYGGGPSVRDLQALLARRLKSRGMSIVDHQVMVTTGSNQAIDLIAKLFLEKGDRVLVEGPTFFAALRIFESYESEICGMPLDDQGLDTDLLSGWLEKERAAGGPAPKLFYVIPNYQNPTGTTLPVSRREKLLALANEYDFIILEDDAYGELYFNSPPPPTLRTMDTEGRVVYTSTFSKIVAPGVRLGWAVGVPEVIAGMSALKSDGGTGPLAQAIVYHYCDGNSLDERIVWLRTQYRERWGAMREALLEHMPRDATFTEPQGGFFTWLTVPGVDTSAIYNEAVENGVTYVEGRSFFPDEQGQESMRLCFSYCDGAIIQEGVRRLAGVIRKGKT